jgi:hypothetical protein
MIEAKPWKEFRELGLLWWVNRTLHLFGWAIVLILEDDGSISSAYPARVRFRGFDVCSESTGFVKLSEYLAQEAPHLLEEAKE